MIRILTVEREFGSGGDVIAKKLSDRLGWKLWDQLLTDEIARRLDCDRRDVQAREERADPTFYGLLKAFILGSFEGSTNPPQFKPVDTESVRAVAQEILTEIAKAGDCVIVGRGSAHILANRRDTFHVFIYAPFPEKVRRLQSIGKSRKEAEDLVVSVDRDRAAFIKSYFSIEWPGRHRFQLMINSCIGEDVAVETILGSFAKVSQKSS